MIDRAPSSEKPNDTAERLRNRMGRILYSTWFAILTLVVAGSGVGLLFYRGMIREAYVGLGLLIFSALLIVIGIIRERPSKYDRDDY